MTDHFDIKGEEHAASVVERFLAVQKTIEGTGDWVCDQQTLKCRLKYALAIDGVIVPQTLDVSHFPRSDIKGFTITLNFPPCILRLDYDPPEKYHDNPVSFIGGFEARVYGPHFHEWADNSRFCDKTNITDELPYARTLPTNIKSYKAALFWFCDRANIVMTNENYVELPPAEWLL